jgi:hypothetical protein
MLRFVAIDLAFGVRGHGFRSVPENQIPRASLMKSDIAWSAAIGLSMVDPIRGFVALKYGALRTLRLGEPIRVARSLSLEAAHYATRGPKTRIKTDSLLGAADEIAQKSGDPYLDSWVSLGRAISAYLQGRWAVGLEKSAEAKRRFSALSRPVLWELDTADTYFLWSLCFLGRAHELHDRRAELLQHANQRGDLYAATYFSTYIMAIDRVAEDQPDAGLSELDAAMSRWSHAGFHLQHHNAVMAAAILQLYTGRAADAYELIAAHWQRYRRALMLNVQHVNVHVRSHRATAAIASVIQNKSGAARLLQVARRDSRALWRLGAPWSRALARQAEAGIELVRGNIAAAIRAEESAIDLFDQAEMALYAAASRFRLGAMLPNASGQSLQLDAASRMASLGVAQPKRLVQIYAPHGV